MLRPAELLLVTSCNLLGRCSYSSRGTDLVSSVGVGVPLGGALKK